MAKKPIKPLIRALAEHAADEVMAAHDAGLPRRKRLPKKFYERLLKEEAPEEIAHQKQKKETEDERR